MVYTFATIGYALGGLAYLSLVGRAIAQRDGVAVGLGFGTPVVLMVALVLDTLA